MVLVVVSAERIRMSLLSSIFFEKGKSMAPAMAYLTAMKNMGDEKERPLLAKKYDGEVIST